RTRDDEDEDELQQKANHGVQVPCGAIGGSGTRSGCADRRPSSAWRAARASGLSAGAMATTCCQAAAAPARSCVPKALTMPRFSSVLVCRGLVLSDTSNCSIARGAWFM